MELGRTEEAWELLPRASAPRRLHRPAPQHADRPRLLPVPRGDGGRARATPSCGASSAHYATQWFPAPGIAFADVHGALAHAFAGNADALAKIIDGAKGPAADIVAPIARAFRAFARSDWTAAIAELETVLAAHERIGGSRAQRDLIEYALAGSLLRAGRIDEARRLLQHAAWQAGPAAGPSRASDDRAGMAAVMLKTALVVLALFAALVAPAGSSAQAAELLMFEDPTCVWCRRWHAEIGPGLPSHARGAVRAPASPPHPRPGACRRGPGAAHHGDAHLRSRRGRPRGRAHRRLSRQFLLLGAARRAAAPRPQGACRAAWQPAGARQLCAVRHPVEGGRRHVISRPLEILEME